MSENRLNRYEIENPFSVLLRDLQNTMSPTYGNKLDKNEKERLKSLVDNAKSELTMWSSSIGYISWLASTHNEVDEQAIEALGLISSMQGKLMNMAEVVNDFDWYISGEAEKVYAESRPEQSN